MDDILRKETAKSAKKELVIAGIATVITLTLAIGLYFLVPGLQASLRSVDKVIRHPREFKALPDGGLITYRVSADTRDQSIALKKYKQDLEILSRRFKRGQYEMAILPGFKKSALARDLVAQSANYAYTVNVKGDSAVLQITSSNKQATEALHKYLTYLEKSWKY